MIYKKNDSKSFSQCPLEQEVSMNLESGDIKGHIRAHLDECPICAEIEKVFGFMNRFQQLSSRHRLPEKQLPTAEAIWDGAFSQPMPVAPLQFQPDQELVRKANLPMRIAQWVTYAVIAISTIYLAVTNLPFIERFFSTDLGGKSMVRSLSNLGPKNTTAILALMIPVAVAIFLVIALIFFMDKEKNESNYQQTAKG